ncbi:MAG: sugar transferase [Chloroflexi bacterium]|nr:sugar transferase [Chloroflexota bacterium]
MSDEFSISNQEISVDEFTGCLTLSPSNSSPFSRILNRFTKRVMDIFISIFTIPTVFLFYAFIGIANKMEDGGPVIYRRKVVGKNGKEFDAFKFRSMLVNADNILEKNPELKKEFEKNYKLENDPRLTKVGALIRRLSIDELPQILNVFSGQMSIVGPRMKVKEEIEKYYGGLKQKLLTVKPGLTGFWQVNGRQKTNYNERVRMDMFYIDHWSIWMDIVILIKTVWKVIKKEGAI